MIFSSNTLKILTPSPLLGLFSLIGAVKTTAVFDIETKPFYWLTVCAQDHGIIPLYSCSQVRKCT